METDKKGKYQGENIEFSIVREKSNIKVSSREYTTDKHRKLME